MRNIYDYLDKYGDLTFDEMEYTEVDNLIFTQIAYLNFEGIIESNENKIRLEDAINLFISQKRKCFIRRAVNIAKSIKNKKRYKNLLLSNYIYKLTDDEQFGALSIDINNHTRCVAFEGTDDTIIGWKEDFSLAYISLIPSAIDAIKYLKKVSKYSKNIIITGHSKGGYLSLISAMYSNFFIKNKIRKIYSLDGPGITKEKLNSRKYRSIKNKYIKIIPKSSVVGKLFYDDEPIVCDSKAIGFLSHSVFTWIIADKEFKRSTLTKFSISIETNLKKWLESYNEDEKKYFCDYIFKSLEKFNIKKTSDLKKLDNYNKELRNYLKSADPKVKIMLKQFLSFVKTYYKDDIKIKSSKIFNIYNS